MRAIKIALAFLFAVLSSPIAGAAPVDPQAESRALLAELVAIDTTNPPGNEALAARAMAKHLEAAGIAPLLGSYR